MEGCVCVGGGYISTLIEKSSLDLNKQYFYVSKIFIWIYGKKLNELLTKGTALTAVITSKMPTAEFCMIYWFDYPYLIAFILNIQLKKWNCSWSFYA